MNSSKCIEEKQIYKSEMKVLLYISEVKFIKLIVT